MSYEFHTSRFSMGSRKNNSIVCKDNEGGYVLVTVAVLLFVLVAFMALAIDTGVLFGARTSSQGAADAAALAGAFTFVANPNSLQPDTAILHAKQTAMSNKVLGTSIEDAQVDVQVVDVAPDPRRVTVTITRSEPTFLAKILNVDTVATEVRGVAEVGRTSTGTKCMKPFFLPNTIFSTKVPCDACASSPPELLVSGGAVTAFAKGWFGQQITVKGNDKSTRLAPGQFYAINVTGPGGDPYRDAISTCFQDFYVCRNTYGTLSGNKVGPTKQGVKDLIGNPPDVYQSMGRYLRPDGTIHDTSKSLVIAPIWDVCNFVDPATGISFCPTGDFPSGSGTSLQIVGFALLFIDGISGGGDVTAELINVVACATTPPTGVDEDAGTVLSLPLRLVRVP